MAHLVVANFRWATYEYNIKGPSKITNHTRNVRLLDGDRIGLAIGTHYQPTKAIGLDFGYTHLFIKNVAVNIITPTGSRSGE